MVKKRTTEICIRCGRSVALGTEWFEGRDAASGTFEDRINSGCLYPHGGYICLECQGVEPIIELTHSRHAAVIRRLRKGIDNIYQHRTGQP